MTTTAYEQPILNTECFCDRSIQLDEENGNESLDSYVTEVQVNELMI